MIKYELLLTTRPGSTEQGGSRKESDWREGLREQEEGGCRSKDALEAGDMADGLDRVRGVR